MIYDKSIFKKELKASYFEHSISVKKRMGYSLFLALLSFADHFVLRTLEQSVLSDAAPKYISPSSFSTISIYIDIFYFFYIFYLATNYHFLTFDEIRNNKWYIPIKFGFSPLRMIFTKLYTRLITIFFVYGLGYVIILFLTSFLKYALLFEYLVPLFILGLIDLFFIVIVTMTSSLYFKKGIISNYVMASSAILIAILKYITGYYAVIGDKSRFKSINILSEFSVYVTILFFISIVCIFIIFIRGKRNAKYYSFSFYELDYDFPDNVSIASGPETNYKKLITQEFDAAAGLRIITKVINSLLAAVIIIFIIFNALVLFISVSTAKKEVPIFNIIPYIFKSDTMQPVIMYNDLAFFSTNIAVEPIKGDIVIYKAKEEVNVGRVKSIQNETAVVDIDNYPSDSEGKNYSETIRKSQIYGKYAGRSRWLGLLILFANSTVGRLLLLLIPVILLFYYKPILEVINFIINNGLS
ncbi:hypothetical protein LY28_02477 [Ruminiclostridium sufflavum DSM 19573]|uniref:Signal peptidase I n=1 Tax=Ruminiclostridium sufflavum DSM 19573 TaxID=1121337 RepID=A0A318XJB2_9FIRM|nr:S26 family signal peptidase [Ruminiclostridium sufflavum]PYG87094.1 hypothetical protein LY28_02477 [Ruminiclostridium sufflavum DSM 19573]